MMDLKKGRQKNKKGSEMIYKKYGQTFRALRRQRGLSLIYFERIGISKSALSMFETGKSMLAFDKLNLALQEMHVSLQFYGMLLNGREMDYFLIKFNEIDQAYYNDNQIRLHNIYKELAESADESLYDLSLAAKARVTLLTRAEKEELQTYFSKIKIWGRYELLLFLNTLEQLEIGLVIKISSDLISHPRQYDYLHILPDFRVIFIRIIGMMIFRLCKLGKKEVAYAFFEKGQALLKESSANMDVTNTVFLKFAEGYWIYTFEDRAKGNRLMKRVIRILADLENYPLRNMFRHYHKLITQNKA
ncbi:helix-turn-helix domain-containing protein [Lactococcus sp. dk322]|nr:helix-turn-helix domain-containing protein [Lactococcus sp. dk101]TXK45220.1 helix-turn-helix domain-containing protein [Lactococcus sp. dk310]TXK51002.1 helix-turn-helix domain-containing protein [Lactococcus sp. dk322]